MLFVTSDHLIVRSNDFKTVKFIIIIFIIHKNSCNCKLGFNENGNLCRSSIFMKNCIFLKSFIKTMFFNK